MLIQISNVLEPTSMDVICSRGRRTQKHSGNSFYRDQIINRCKAYQQETTKIEKGYITKEIIDLIRARGGTFLKKDADGWKELAEDDTHNKVSNALRSTARAIQQATKKKKEKHAAKNKKNQDPMRAIVRAMGPAPKGFRALFQQQQALYKAARTAAGKSKISKQDKLNLTLSPTEVHTSHLPQVDGDFSFNDDNVDDETLF